MADLSDNKEDVKNIRLKIEKDTAPVTKSSTEILSELFGVFNAEPPDISFNPKKSKAKTKKLKKKSKHKEKKKKKSDKRGRSSSDSDLSVIDTQSHKKKSKKSKHKKKKRKSSDSDSDGYKPSHGLYFPDPKDYAKDYLESVSILEKVSNNRKVTVDDTDHYTIQVNNEPSTPEKPKNSRASDQKISESKNNNYPMDNIPIPKTPDVSQIKLPEEKNSSSKTKSNPVPPENNVDKGKAGSNKIQIKNLKFSSVFEANVKQAEEEARKKAEKHAEKYEEGELSENSSEVLKLSSDSESGSDQNKTPDLRDKLNEISSVHKKMKSDSKSADNNKKSEKRSHRSRSRSHRKSRSRSRKRSHSKTRKRSRSRSRNKRSHSRDRKTRYDKYDDRSRSHRQERRRSKSREKHMEIDKKRLLEIARKNAITMLQTGTLPAASTLGPQAQQKVISAIKSGGKSVDELTDFCKNLSRQEALGELSSVSSDSDNDNDRDLHDSEARPFHHPFQVKDKAPIVLNIKGGTPLPTQSFQEKTIEQSKVLRLQFPVSSGTHHRGAESEWKPVSPPSTIAPVNKNSSPIPPLPKHVPIPSPFTKKPQPPIPVAPPPLPPALPPPPQHSVDQVKQPVHPHPHNAQHLYGEVTAQLEYNSENNFNQTTAEVYPQPVLPGPQVFPLETNANYDIGSIVSQRLTAIRKLQQNPNDSSAMNQMYHANKEMSKWAQSKQEPGQFTGSTGANILTPRELASGYQAWAKRDQLQTAAPVSGGMGMHLLQKMGWRPGEGLGKEKNGALTPIMLEVKLDTRGLVAKEETRQRNNVRRTPVATVKTLAGKHPVSLLGEFCSKRKLGVPSYTLCFECGPDHKKNFLFKVTVDGVEYKPSVASANKKQAKADAAQICLQKLGLLS